jgi:hypothetical protein
MEVSMDGLRKRMIADYNSLTKKLNKNIKDKSWDPHITIDPETIRDELEGIRNGLITLAFCYIDGPGGFSELDENTHFEVFYDEEEENKP